MRNIPDLTVWTAIQSHLATAGLNWSKLGELTGYVRPCGRAARGDYGSLPTGFLQSCVDFFGLRIATRARFEDAADTLTDEECREALVQHIEDDCLRCMFRQTCDHKLVG